MTGVLDRTAPALPRAEIVPARRAIRQTLSNALIVTRREVRDSLRDWRIMAPIFMLTLIFPLLANGMTEMFTDFFETNGADDLLPALLPLMPMIVGFFPVSISLVIALETFVGEKERLSLEPLLSTPLTNTELYLGKSFAAMLPPLMASYTGMTIYILGLVWGEQQWRPEPLLVAQIVLLTTVQALVMVTGAVVVSSQTTSTRAANLLASFIIIPVSMLVMLESVIMVQPHRRYLLWYIMLGLLVTVVLLIRMGARIFNREELLGRSLDQINLRYAFRTTWEQFRGPVGDRFTLWRWYRLSVFPAVAALRTGAGGRADLHRRGVRGRLDRRGSLGDPARPVRGQRRNADRQPAVVVRAGPGQPPAHRAGDRTECARAAGGDAAGDLHLRCARADPGDAAVRRARLHAGAGHRVRAQPAAVLHGRRPARPDRDPRRAHRRGRRAAPGQHRHPPAGWRAGRTAWLRALGDTLKIGLGVVLPLIVLAGVLEVSLTPRVVEFVLTH